MSASLTPSIKNRLPVAILTALLSLASLGTVACAGGASAQPQTAQDAKAAAPAPKEAISETTPEIQDSKSSAPKAAHRQDPADKCEDGVVLDDGTVEGGYGFFPNLEWGAFVQRYDSKELSGKKVDRVCVCLIESEGLEEVDFEVVFYKEVNGQPEAEPFASAKGVAIDVPSRIRDAGRFYSVPVEDVTLPEEPSYVGVRWDPSMGRVFICSSKGTPDEPGEQTLGFQRDSRSTKWDNVLTTRDRTFALHQNALIRVVPEKASSAGDDKSKEKANGS